MGVGGCVLPPQACPRAAAAAAVAVVTSDVGVPGGGEPPVRPLRPPQAHLQQLPLWTGGHTEASGVATNQTAGRATGVSLSPPMKPPFKAETGFKSRSIQGEKVLVGPNRAELEGFYDAASPQRGALASSASWS